MKFFKYLFLCPAFSLWLASCSSPKEIAYFQDIDKYTNEQLSSMESSYSTVIRPDDELAIAVSSPDPLATASFNLPALSAQTLQRMNSNVTANQIEPNAVNQSYLVSQTGEIQFPVLGRLKIGGMTRDEAVSFIEGQLKEYIKDPIVNLKILNFKVSVLGEVMAPGSYYFVGQRVSLLDALAAAKDMTIYGRRDNILLIRDNDGKKEYLRFNLMKGDVLTSSNFYLQQNDVVYVYPNQQKQNESDIGVQKQFNQSVITSAIGITFSALSTAATLIIALQK